MANVGKFVALNDTTGRLKEEEGIDMSTGATDACKLIKTNSSGVLDSTLLPAGVGADTKVAEASENLSAGDFVNLFNDAGTLKVRLADNSNSRQADGFVEAAVTSGSNATVVCDGTNSNLAGLTIGDRYYLDTAGNITNTVPTGNVLFQFVGVALSATELSVELDDGIERC